MSKILTTIDRIYIDITNIFGKNIEVTRLFLNLEIYENIFDKFLSGKIIIADTIDLISNFNLIGNETININLYTINSDKNINLSFKIYKVNPENKTNNNLYKRKTIELFFCSNELIEQKNNISKKLIGQGNQLISDLLTTNLLSNKTFNYDSSNELTIFSNFWSPSKIIDFICANSENNYKDYIFFENLNGFNFKTISSLINVDPIHDITFKKDDDSLMMNNNIHFFKFSSYYNILDSLKNGLFGNTFYSPNNINNEFDKVSNTLIDNLNDIVTNGNRRYFDDSLSNIENNIGLNYYNPDISLNRLTSLKMLTNYNLSIRLNGDFTRKSGDNLNIYFPNLDNESIINESFNGNWFILGIKHIISQNNQFRQNIVLNKNAFFNNTALPKISGNIKL